MNNLKVLLERAERCAIVAAALAERGCSAWARKWASRADGFYALWIAERERLAGGAR